MHLKIGTRTSQLALAQTRYVISKIQEHFPHIDCQIVEIQTTGDILYNANLQILGGKGLFLKEIEIQLLSKEIDIAVHSMKDVPAIIPDGLIVDCVLEREDPRDVFISTAAKSLSELPKNATIGTCASRRKAFLQKYHSNLIVKNMRGNVDTRIRKLQEGQADALILALAGLNRLNFAEYATEVLDIEKFIPAIGQGAIGIECRESDYEIIEILKSINHLQTHQCITAERAFLKAFGGDCSTPLAAYAELKAGEIHMNAAFFDVASGNILYSKQNGEIKDVAKIGIDAAMDILAQIGAI